MEKGATVFLSALDVGARIDTDVSYVIGAPDVSGRAFGEQKAGHDEELRLAAYACFAGGLWNQRQDHLKCLRAIRRRLEAGDTHAAVNLLDRFEDVPDKVDALIRSRVENRPVASLLVGKAALAQRLGIRLELDPESRLGRLPLNVEGTAAVSIIGNLIQNAFDAVHGLSLQHRRVSVLLSDAGDQLHVRVRDWGPGLGDSTDEALVCPGFSTKPGHSGVGLAIVGDLIAAAGGTLTIERPRTGTIFDVTIPHG